MKTSLPYLLIGFFCLSLHPVFAGNNAKAHKNAIIHVAAHATSLQVKLPANPTTGYEWVLKSYNKNVLQPTQSHYSAAKNSLIGGGGNKIFEFKVLHKTFKTRQTNLLFEYRRPWEKKLGTIKKVLIQFDF